MFKYTLNSIAEQLPWARHCAGSGVKRMNKIQMQSPAQSLSGAKATSLNPSGGGSQGGLLKGDASIVS